MGLNVSKRVSSLRKQVDQTQVGRWSVARTGLLSFLVLTIFSLFALPKEEPIEFAQVEEPTQILVHRQRVKLLSIVAETRRSWIDDSFITLMPGSASSYENFAKETIASFAATEPKTEKAPSAFELDGLTRWFSFYSAQVVLRSGFVVIAFWPIWLLTAVAGYLFATKRRRTSKMSTILSVLTRGLGPFYSGIYGPLRPNNSVSATDLSCPSLACPPMASVTQASTHQLYKTLKKYDAINETNVDLVRTVLAHGNFPPFVGEEIPVQQEELEQGLGAIELEDRRSNTGYFEIEGNHTLENHAIEGLVAVLEAHARIVRYRAMLEKRSFNASTLNKNYPAHTNNIGKLFKGVSPLSKQLLQVLSPDRLWALAALPSSMIATSYLAIEAGKSLVYKRHGEGFTRISNYPHLQARAVVQSVSGYHKEYDGDRRLIIRQAIICSRRHGDFGRAFLPNRMPIESRALRDWLEIMYSVPEERSTIADLVELDAHIEEISINWKQGFTELVQESPNQVERPRSDTIARGMPFKSVVLFPIESVIQASLTGLHPNRLERVTKLLSKTQKYQAHLSISAKLPGFKRQAMEAERSGEDSDAIIKMLQERPNGEKTLEQWRITRRMLTRYNWLSTRVGDDAVPVTGLVLGKIADGDSTPLSPLAPIRQRRFVDLYGRQWEKKLYGEQIDSDLIEVHTSPESLNKANKASEDDASVEEKVEEKVAVAGSN